MPPPPPLRAALALLTAFPLTAAAQAHAHAPEAERAWHAGAHAVALGTRVAPAFDGEALTEGYLTQPTLYGGLTLFDGLLSLAATLSLEGLTLERGELAPGTYGEGYVDRRHPHTYLHELVATATPPVAGASVSLTLGRGFAPFGTDDPMVRPFVRYPVNHHLGQVLERLVAIGAVRRGPLILEAGLFSGDEPESPRHLGSPERFGDSWAARVTVLPLGGLELQGSRAWLTSPEFPDGGAWDQRKWSASARWRAPSPIGGLYALLEWKRTTEVDQGEDVFAFGSVLAETSLERGAWSAALRAERTDRPEEERTEPFRTPWPHADAHVLGITRWTVLSARAERAFTVAGVRAAPFAELSRAHVGDRVRGLFEPEAFYGARDIWSLSLGARLGVGTTHHRMGRYGAALPARSHHDESHEVR